MHETHRDTQHDHRGTHRDTTSSPAAVLDALADIVIGLADDGTIAFVNEAAARHGWVVAEWLGRSVFDVIHPDDLAYALSSMSTLHAKSEGTPIEVRVAHPIDGWRWFEVIGRDCSADPDVGLMVLACRDLTERRKWEVAAGDGDRFRAVLQHAAAITLLVRPDGHIEAASGAIVRSLGYDPEHVVGRPLAELAALGYASEIDAALFSDKRPLRVIEVPVRPVGGDLPRPFRFEIVDLCTDPVVGGFIVTAYDVSDLFDVREELRLRASHDQLTGLPNRVGLASLLDTALSARSDSEQVAVLLVDLDRFKAVNDLLGHEAGDELLLRFAGRLRSIVGPGDAVIRLGGDEFVVIACGLASRDDALALAHRIELEAATEFVLASGAVHLSASVGVVLAEADANPAMLLAEADNAMHRVKVARPQTSGHHVRRVSERRALASALAGAIERGEIEAWFQPIVAACDGQLLSFEALARWRHPSGALITPDGFLDVAEEMGLLPAIDTAMLRLACRQLAALDVAPTTRVSVNFTAADLADGSVVQRVVDALADAHLDPSRLCIEVTEQAMLEWPSGGSFASPPEVLGELTRLGVTVALDDFGTGYSSLTHVRRFAPKTLKIDRSFISGITENAADRELVTAIMGLAKAIGVSTVAEGVETAAQLDLLRELGCDAIQGYLIGKPMPLAKVREWLADAARQLASRAALYP